MPGFTQRHPNGKGWQVCAKTKTKQNAAQRNGRSVSHGNDVLLKHDDSPRQARDKHDDTIVS
jgi:hypothetical protein